MPMSMLEHKLLPDCYNVSGGKATVAFFSSSFGFLIFPPQIAQLNRHSYDLELSKKIASLSIVTIISCGSI